MDKLWPFQVKGVAFLASRQAAILADEMGLGKTIQAIVAATSRRGPVLVVTRGLAKYNWVREILKWDPEATPDLIRVCVEAGVFDEVTVRTWFKYPRQRGYLIIHHEALRYIYPVLQRFGIWEVVICDEVHHFRNKKAQQTQALWQVPALHRWGLSGTLMHRSVADYWAPLHWINQGVFSSFYKFRDTYVGYTRQGRAFLKEPELFATNVGPYILRRTMDEVYPDLPPGTRLTHFLQLSEAQRAVYRSLKKDVLADLGNESDPLFVGNTLARMQYLQQFTLTPNLLGLDDPGPKLQWIVDWYDDYDVPCIIYTISRRVANALGETLPDAATISGDVKDSVRQSVMKDFDEGKLRCVVGTIDTMSEAVNFPRAEVAIFLQVHPSSNKMEQAEKRIRRMTSTHPVQWLYALCDSSIDTVLYNNLQYNWTQQQLISEFLKELRDGNDNGTDAQER